LHSAIGNDARDWCGDLRIALAKFGSVKAGLGGKNGCIGGLNGSFR